MKRCLIMMNQCNNSVEEYVSPLSEIHWVREYGLFYVGLVAHGLFRGKTVISHWSTLTHCNSMLGTYFISGPHARTLFRANLELIRYKAVI